MNTDANAAAAAWVSGLSSKTQKISDGIDRVTVAPGQMAARAKGLWAANTAAAVDRFAARSQAVSLQEWQAAAKGKGLQRIASGAQGSQDKMVRVFSKLLPAIDAAVKSLPSRGTFEQNKARSMALMDKLHAQAGTFGA